MNNEEEINLFKNQIPLVRIKDGRVLSDGFKYRMCPSCNRKILESSVRWRNNRSFCPICREEMGFTRSEMIKENKNEKNKKSKVSFKGNFVVCPFCQGKFYPENIVKKSNKLQCPFCQKELNTTTEDIETNTEPKSDLGKKLRKAQRFFSNAFDSSLSFTVLGNQVNTGYNKNFEMVDFEYEYEQSKKQKDRLKAIEPGTIIRLKVKEHNLLGEIRNEYVIEEPKEKIIDLLEREYNIIN